MDCRRHKLLLTLALLLAFFTPGEAKRMANSCADITNDPSMLKVTMTTLSHTVTNFDPSWFDTKNPEKGPVLFMITVGQPANADTLAGKLRLHLVIEADTTLGRDENAPKVIAIDRVSIPLEAAQIGVPLRSNDVFAFTWSPGYGQDFEESDFFDLLVDKRSAPEMDLYFRFAITCETSTPVAAVTPAPLRLGDIGRLRYVKTIQALYPGTPITSSKPVAIYTINPIFKVVSEIFSKDEFNYPDNEPKIEVYLYELQVGQTPDDAMQGLEYAKIPLFNESPSAYPADQPRLQPGQTYVWRARAILRGPTTDYLYSNPLYFKIDERLEGASSAEAISNVSDLTALEQQIKFGDDYSKRLMAALKVILGDNFEVFDLSRGGKVPAKGQIRLNGHPYSLEELERLAREFSASRHSITRLRFQ